MEDPDLRATGRRKEGTALHAQEGREAMSAWTKDKPTTGGWRWYSDDRHGTMPVFLEHMPDGLFVELAVVTADTIHDNIIGLHVDELPGEWAPMPGPPK
jgi:hypothetical protein